MKTVLSAMLILALAGCGVELLTTTAIQSELQAEQATAIKRQVGAAADTTAQINIQRAIDTFQAENGKYPGSLDELVPGYLPSLPTQPDGTPYAYDSASGKLVDGPRRNVILGPTAGDRQKMKQITQAVNSYGMATGYYPPSLDAMVPQYISAIPKTDSGEDFIFRPEDGALLHPAQQNQPAAPITAQQRRLNAPAVGGAGPMGEAMTGIGMQQQLDSMSNAGSSSAAGCARGRADRAVQQQQQQQEQALKQLGY